MKISIELNHNDEIGDTSGDKAGHQPNFNLKKYDIIGFDQNQVHAFCFSSYPSLICPQTVIL